jgi:PKD repeat protein
MKKIYLMLLVLTALPTILWSQNRWCGHDDYRALLEAEYPGNTFITKQAQEQLMRQLAENPSIGESRGGVRTIPIVFHVVWNIGAENISDAIIQQQLDRLNDDFATSYLNTQVAQFQNVATNPMIQFCLASTDPQGNATTGITRTQTSTTSFSVGNDMKSSTTGGKNPWPFNSYYNVWICDIGFDPNSGGTAGFAYLPSYGAQFEAIDGTVLAYQVVGGGETTLSHETGHYLGLNHTWGDFESCSSDDGFADTPNCDGPNFGSFNNNYCPLTATSCGSLDNVENFMDYSSCPTMFTQQQSAYMNTILSTTYSSFQGVAGRAGLIASSGCDGQQVAAPVADFVGNPTTVNVGANVSFTDLSTNSPISWAWTFGDGGVSSSQNPTHAYAATGQYTVQLTATNGTGSDVEVKTNYITVVDNGGGGTTTCDSLVYLDGEFIVQINSTDAATFEALLIDNDQAAVATTLANQGYTSDWIQFYEEVAPLDTNFFWGATSWHTDATVPADNWITFGPITIPSDGADLSWRHSFISMTYRDGYEVLLNTNGTDVTDFNSATVLFTVIDNDPNTLNDTDWGNRSVNLPAGTYAGQQVYIGFHHNALDQYVLFLDDIYMEGCNTILVGTDELNTMDIQVYPNPSVENFTVRFENNSKSVNMTLVNTLGQIVWEKSITEQGTVNVQIDTRSISKGAYTLMLSGDEVYEHRKLILTK